MKQEYIWNRSGELWYPGDIRKPYEVNVKSSEKEFLNYLEIKINEAIVEYNEL